MSLDWLYCPLLGLHGLLHGLLHGFLHGLLHVVLHADGTDMCHGFAKRCTLILMKSPSLVEVADASADELDRLPHVGCRTIGTDPGIFQGRRDL